MDAVDFTTAILNSWNDIFAIKAYDVSVSDQRLRRIKIRWTNSPESLKTIYVYFSSKNKERLINQKLLSVVYFLDNSNFKENTRKLALLLLTIFVLCVYKFIKSIECRLSLAIDVVPPITNEVLLIEHGSIWTKKTVSIPIRLAHVENLSKWIKLFCYCSPNMANGNIEYKDPK